MSQKINGNVSVYLEPKENKQAKGLSRIKNFFIKNIFGPPTKDCVTLKDLQTAETLISKTKHLEVLESMNPKSITYIRGNQDQINGLSPDQFAQIGPNEYLIKSTIADQIGLCKAEIQQTLEGLSEFSRNGVIKSLSHEKENFLESEGSDKATLEAVQPEISACDRILTYFEKNLTKEPSSMESDK